MHVPVCAHIQLWFNPHKKPTLFPSETQTRFGWVVFSISQKFIQKKAKIELGILSPSPQLSYYFVTTDMGNTYSLSWEWERCENRHQLHNLWFVNPNGVLSLNRRVMKPLVTGMERWLSGQQCWLLFEDPDSISSIHIAVNHLECQSQGIRYPLLASTGIMHIHGAQNYMQAKYPYT